MIKPIKFFDDLEVGDRFESLARTITETDLVNYVALTGLYDEQFVNREYAKAGFFGGPIIPAPMIEAVANGLFNNTGVLRGATVAYMSSQLKAIAPLFVGDTIRNQTEVMTKKRSSRPDRGVVTFLHTVTNQHAQVIISFNTTYMMWRSPELVEAEE